MLWTVSKRLISEVDPFIGCAATELPNQGKLAKTWWWPKPQVGNTHPGACFPFGMVSACAYSGAYPTGYGLYAKNTEGLPPRVHEKYQASGFTHFQQSGTGAIRKYYNYFRVTPLTEGLDTLGQQWPLLDEEAEPGFYAARLSGPEIHAELTVGEKASVHRYTFPESRRAFLAIDFSSGGLALRHGRTLPSRADLELVGPGKAQGTVVLEGIPLSIYLEVDSEDLRQSLFYDSKPVGGGKRMVFDYIRQTTLRNFGVVFSGPMEAGQQVQLRVGFSLRGVEQARKNCQLHAAGGFDAVRTATAEKWRQHLGRIQVEGGTTAARKVFYSSLYRSLIKPCFARNESPSWPNDGPFVFDICTMWDIYKTQLPLVNVLYPERGVQLLNALIRVGEEEGNFPIGYRMARGADRFYRQASALAHTALADALALKLPGIDWEWALAHMHNDLLRTYGEDFYEKGVVHPLTHTLDLAVGYHCTAQVAKAVGDTKLVAQLEEHVDNWRKAFDPQTGLLADSTYYEGGKHNYSFRLLHDMQARVELAGGDQAFVEMLDRFFGFGAEPVKQLGAPPFDEAELEAGYALGRFEGLNNEPDMEAPFAYYYAGRPDRSAEVVQAILEGQFGLGRGGLPGNDDSGGLSSWYVWAALGLFPVAGQNVYLIGVPSFCHTTLSVAGAELEIFRRNKGENPRFITRVTFSEKEITRSYLLGNELLQGGRLVVEVGNEPSGWGRTQRPPSTPRV